MIITPTLPGRVIGAPLGALGCDTLGILTADHVKVLVQSGFAFCVRYVNLPSYPDEPALTAAEARRIVDGGLALMVVQRARAGTVTASGGKHDGSYAAQRCTALGLPEGVNVWLDLEGIDGAVFDYANQWSAQVSSSGYASGIYVGANLKDHGSPVTGQQLYYNFNVTHYWRSQSAVPNVDMRGYQMIQLFPEADPLGLGFAIAIDITQFDYLRGTVQWLAPTLG